MSLLMLSGLAFTRVGNFRYLSPVRTLIQTETQMCVTQREAIEAIGYHLPGRTFRCVSSLRTFRSRCGRFFGTVSDCACVVTPVFGYSVWKCWTCVMEIRDAHIFLFDFREKHGHMYEYLKCCGWCFELHNMIVGQLKTWVIIWDSLRHLKFCKFRSNWNNVYGGMSNVYGWIFLSNCWFLSFL